MVRSEGEGEAVETTGRHAREKRDVGDVDLSDDARDTVERTEGRRPPGRDPGLGFHGGYERRRNVTPAERCGTRRDPSVPASP